MFSYFKNLLYQGGQGEYARWGVFLRWGPMLHTGSPTPKFKPLLTVWSRGCRNQRVGFPAFLVESQELPDLRENMLMMSFSPCPYHSFQLARVCCPELRYPPYDHEVTSEEESTSNRCRGDANPHRAGPGQAGSSATAAPKHFLYEKVTSSKTLLHQA